MNLARRLQDEVNKRRPRIVVCGDAMVDQWVHGRIEDCQDGCPKFVEESRMTTPGGAANAARCLDLWDPVIVDLFSCNELEEEIVLGDAYPIKTRFVKPDGKILIRWDSEPRPNTKWYRPHNLALEMVGCAAGVLLSDYDKGFLTPEFIRKVVDLCKERGIPCVADCKREPDLYFGATIKCNKDWNDRHYHSPKGQWNHRVGGPWVLTLGERQCVVNPTGQYDDTHLCGVEKPAVKCVNHVGAGDCFGAHLTLALACGFSLQDAAALAHSAGRVYVQHPHNRPPYPDEIAADLDGASR